MKKMKLHKTILIDQYPDNDEVQLCIFTRPKYPIQYRDRWNKDVKFACSPSAYKSFKRLKIRRAVEIEKNNCFLVDGQELRFTCIEHDGFGSYMLIIHWMVSGEKDKQVLYTGQFTNYRTALINGLSEHVGNITDIYIDNTLAFIEHSNSLETACETVQNYLKEYEGYKVYLDFENLFGYEDLMVNLAKRNIKIELHDLQKRVMECGNNLQHFQFEGKPDLTVFHRPERNNWYLEDYERFFNDDKNVYLKFIATKATKRINTENVYHRPRPDEKPERIESKFKGFHYVVYSSHATKHTLASLIKLVKPSRIHPLHMPVQMDNVWSNVIPKDIIQVSSKLVIPSEPELPEIDWHETFGGKQFNNNDMESGKKVSETRMQSSLSNRNNQCDQRGQKKERKEGSYLGTSTEGEFDDEYDDIPIEAPVLVIDPKEKPKSPPKIQNVEPVEIIDDEIGSDDDKLISTELNSGHYGDRDQLTENQNVMDVDNSSDGNDHHTENELRSSEKQQNTGAGNPTLESLVGVVPNQTDKENQLNVVNNNGKQIETVPAHCYDDNVQSQATRSNQLIPTQSRISSKRRNPLSSLHDETNVQKLHYFPETDDESGNDDDEINIPDSSSSSTISPLNFD